MRLSPTSYVVLGLVEVLRTATPYDLKRLAQISVFNFWPLPHTQLYTECARLAQGGMLDERREESGRRRRLYRLTAAGRGALDEWRADPAASLSELRDAGLLKLFFGADPTTLAESQLAAHQERLKAYEALHAGEAMTGGMRQALEAGIGHERLWVRYWRALRDGEDALEAMGVE